MMKNDINADEFTYQCINTKTNEVVFEGKGKSYDCPDEIIILNKVGEIK